LYHSEKKPPELIVVFFSWYIGKDRHHFPLTGIGTDFFALWIIQFLGKPEIPLLTGFGQGFLYSGIALLFPETATTDIDGYDYNVIKNFNGIKIVRWIAIYNISPDIVSE